jgi:hypothetical protein
VLERSGAADREAGAAGDGAEAADAGLRGDSTARTRPPALAEG